MRIILGGIRQLLWNDDQGRLRAPLRLAAMAASFLVVVLVVDAVGSLFETVFGADRGTAEGTVVIAVMGMYVLGILAIGRAVDRRHFSDYGLGIDSRWRADALLGLSIGAGMAGVTVLAGLISGHLSVDASALSAETGLFAGLSPIAGTVAGVFFLLLFVFFYELVFRGFVLVNVAEGLAGATTERGAVLSGVLVSAVLFAVVHAPLSDAAGVTLTTLFLFSLVVGCLVAATGRLAGALGVHAGWALLVGPVFGTPFRGIDSSTALLALERDGPTALVGGTFGLDGSLLALCGLVAGAFCLLVWRQYGSLEFTVASQIPTPDLLDRSRWR
ncbi:CPBP family intramembrane glutamic endopeptidase [Halovenus marina]|uniref:CPBP family intramembrane glutamic endopeptidase n=1 Tax=Halovenus marina TaxID=3396621 RepID=UPI003F568D9C